jgi:16S rRNA (cytidine1402-2'-O)-methyltransferase
MSGTLYVVATPIGNLEDITLRAIRVLREANVIAAEDTRRTAKLLAHYTIGTPTISFHAHNTRSRIPQIIARLERGDSVALVTDAGTPGISDPGSELVHACRQKGLTVDPIPGASAPLAAAMASGFPLEPLTILGFAPSRAKDRTAWFERIIEIKHAVVFFDVPHRIAATLTELGSLLGERQIFLARELTKVHQQFIRGRASDIVGLMTEERGEFTVVVGPAAEAEPAKSGATDQEIYREFGRSVGDSEASRRSVIAAIARKHGRPSREVYSIIERLKDSGV